MERQGKEEYKKCVSMVRHRLSFSFSFSFSLFLLLNLATTAFSALKFSRNDFPDDFIFGAGTSAYQVC